jgi:hypothetical protein
MRPDCLDATPAVGAAAFGSKAYMNSDVAHLVLITARLELC